MIMGVHRLCEVLYCCNNLILKVLIDVQDLFTPDASVHRVVLGGISFQVNTS